MAITVVELAGLPGSGKTTLAERLVEEMRSSGVPCTVADANISARARKEVRMVRRAGYALREVAGEPGASRRAAGVLVRSRQEAGRDTAAVLAQWLATERLASRSREGSGVRLLEEGLVQTVWTATLRAGRLDPGDLWSCLPSAAHPDLVLYLDARPDLAARRLSRRTSRHSRLQQGPATSLVGELRRGQAIFDQLLLTSPVRVARLTAGGSSLDALVAQAAELLHQAHARGAERASDLH